jgi:predicted secreted protein
MPSSGLMNGTTIVLSIKDADGGTYSPIGHATSSSISYSLDTPDATSKDSSGYREVIAGVRSLDMSFDGFVAYDDPTSIEELMVFINNRTKVNCKFATAITGDVVYSCDGFLTSIDYTADSESPVTYSGTFSSTGSVTIGTNP